ncbi:hypothetical protein HPT27_05140 [Permianibacter sp. IMCC34836]|uniref:hypothetical protein n=1 Tax=Permianibacter fluminis TaxID=2738515 RepID=UPI001556C847|nr:hypothetical protein [Permianibacter fluminis]NQD36402.1 hypothetical protein [Permianibacter fluminis]
MASDSREFHHPSAVRMTEQQLLARRRAAARVELDQVELGVAVSGGGIRSATFALGFFQGLARGDGRVGNLLPKVDWLSTVSGGGYFGSFLGRLFQSCGDPQSVTEQLLNPHSGPVEHLRRHGRYLAPGGNDDGWLAFAYMLRSLLMVQVLFAALAYTVGLLTLLLSPLLEPLTRYFSTSAVGISWLAMIQTFSGPWLSLTIFPVAGFLLLGILYYFYALLVDGGEEARIARPWLMLSADDEKLRRHRYCLTLWQGRCLTILVLLLVLALLQGLGTVLANPGMREKFLDEFAVWAAGVLAGAETVLLFGRRIMASLIGGKGEGGSKFTLPLSVVGALAGSLVLLSLAVLGFALAAHVLHFYGWPRYQQFAVSHWLWLAVQIGFLFLIACWVNLINSTSLHPFYYARLARSFLSAALLRNRDVMRGAQCGAGGTTPGDLPLSDYQPDKEGGPLHLINCTINETVEADSNLWRADRKGINLSVSHWLYSVGARHHLLRDQNGWSALGPSFPTKQHPKAINQSPTGRLFSGCEGHEELTVGRWVGISGAAFSTGLGSLTHWWSSVICAVGNVRLGYWWRTRKLPFWSYYCPRLFRYMVQELLGYFRGTTAPYWYLSDGGHFENMGAYEMIRRRVPVLVIIDAECDPNYQYQGFGNLVHKARMDFGCEIRVLSDDERRARFAESSPLVSLETLRGKIDGELRQNGGRASLAVGWYTDNTDDSREPDIWILYVKPAMCGDESVDLQHYRSENPDFPQQTTMDQFFDEVQWESYRKLGEQTGVQMCCVIDRLVSPGLE